MNSRLMRVLIVVIGIVIGSTAAYFLKNLDTSINAHRAAADTLQDRAKALDAAIADVRAGQLAYVARGQGEAFWMTRVADLLPVLQQREHEFQSALTAPAARAAFESAAAALENFRTLDARVKEFVSSGNALLAADLIFSDGLEATATASAQAAIALNHEVQTRTGGIVRMRNRQMAILGGSAAGILLLMLVLAFTAADGRKVDEPQVTMPPIDHIRFEAPLPKAKPAITPKLVRTAQLCGELSKVVEGGQLPNLLERTAKIIEASGMIVWIADPASGELRAAMSYGYTDQVMARMKGIPRDANNAAAAAYRAAETRTVPGEGTANGAVIVPLMTGDGCIGVLSAEMKNGSEKDESSRALATIFAAQLATLVAPPAAPARAVAQA